MANILGVPYRRQKADGYCLAACAQMVLAHLGVFYAQDDLARRIGVRPLLGAPASNVLRLRSENLDVTYTDGSLQDIANWLAEEVPVIAFVQAGELTRWRGHRFQYAIVVIGLDEQIVCFFDPATEASPVEVPIDSFLLAWGEMDHVYATITRQT